MNGIELLAFESLAKMIGHYRRFARAVEGTFVLDFKGSEISATIFVDKTLIQHGDVSTTGITQGRKDVIVKVLSRDPKELSNIRKELLQLLQANNMGYRSRGNKRVTYIEFDYGLLTVQH